jgi:quercetin dioxygenase-like cupin family protein
MSGRDEHVFLRGMEGIYDMREYLRVLRAKPRVIKSGALPWRKGPIQWNKDLVAPVHGHTQAINAHTVELAPGGRSAKHGHQNEAVFYVLDGRGYDVHDGKRYDWQAGDVMVVPNQCVHQHINADPEKPANMLVIKTKPLFMYLHLIFQEVSEADPKRPEGYRPAGF